MNVSKATVIYQWEVSPQQNSFIKLFLFWLEVFSWALTVFSFLHLSLIHIPLAFFFFFFFFFSCCWGLRGWQLLPSCHSTNFPVLILTPGRYCLCWGNGAKNIFFEMFQRFLFCFFYRSALLFCDEALSENNVTVRGLTGVALLSYRLKSCCPQSCCRYGN